MTCQMATDRLLHQPVRAYLSIVMVTCDAPAIKRIPRSAIRIENRPSTINIGAPENQNRPKLVRDPICRMMVDEKGTKLKSEYGGQTFYFCNASCKNTFDKDPGKYARKK